MARQAKKGVNVPAKKSGTKKVEKPVKKTAAPAKRSKAVKAAKKASAPKKPAAKRSAAKKPVVKQAAKKPTKKPAARPKKATGAAKKAVAAKRPVSKNAVAKGSANVKAAKKPANGKAPKLNVDQVIKDFRRIVNLKPDQLERWLSKPDSKKLGFKDEVKAGTVGHESGRRILKILSKRRDKYTDDDLRHMETVVVFVRRHRREKPPGDVFASNWRYSLMNWGHDPMK
jgi:hypothetical protein